MNSQQAGKVNYIPGRGAPVSSHGPIIFLSFYSAALVTSKVSSSSSVFGHAFCVGELYTHPVTHIRRPEAGVTLLSSITSLPYCFRHDLSLNLEQGQQILGIHLSLRSQHRGYSATYVTGLWGYRGSMCHQVQPLL